MTEMLTWWKSCLWSTHLVFSFFFWWRRLTRKSTRRLKRLMFVRFVSMWRMFELRNYVESEEALNVHRNYGNQSEDWKKLKFTTMRVISMISRCLFFGMSCHWTLVNRNWWWHEDKDGTFCHDNEQRWESSSRLKIRHNSLGSYVIKIYFTFQKQPVDVNAWRN